MRSITRIEIYDTGMARTVVLILGRGEQASLTVGTIYRTDENAPSRASTNRVVEIDG